MNNKIATTTTAIKNAVESLDININARDFHAAITRAKKICTNTFLTPQYIAATIKQTYLNHSFRLNFEYLYNVEFISRGNNDSNNDIDTNELTIILDYNRFFAEVAPILVTKPDKNEAYNFCISSMNDIINDNRDNTIMTIKTALHLAILPAAQPKYTTDITDIIEHRNEIKERCNLYNIFNDKEIQWIKYPPSELKKAIKTTAAARATNGAKPILTGIHFTCNHIEASDGYRAHRYYIKPDFHTRLNPNITIKDIETILKLYTDKELSDMITARIDYIDYTPTPEEHKKMPTHSILNLSSHDMIEDFLIDILGYGTGSTGYFDTDSCFNNLNQCNLTLTITPEVVQNVAYFIKSCNTAYKDYKKINGIKDKELGIFYMYTNGADNKLYLMYKYRDLKLTQFVAVKSTQGHMDKTELLAAYNLNFLIDIFAVIAKSANDTKLSWTIKNDQREKEKGNLSQCHIINSNISDIILPVRLKQTTSEIITEITNS